MSRAGGRFLGRATPLPEGGGLPAEVDGVTLASAIRNHQLNGNLIAGVRFSNRKLFSFDGML